MIYYPSDCEVNIPQPVCSNCPVPELGRIRSFGFVRDDFSFSLASDAAEWTAGIDAGQIFIIPGASGSFDGGTPNLKPGYGNVHQRLVSYTFKMSVVDPNYIENCDFWDAMDKLQNFRPFYVTETQVHIADKPATIIPIAPVEDDDQSEVVWKVEMEWVSKTKPCPVDKPEGIFQCFAVV